MSTTAAPPPAAPPPVLAGALSIDRYRNHPPRLTLAVRCDSCRGWGNRGRLHFHSWDVDPDTAAVADLADGEPRHRAPHCTSPGRSRYLHAHGGAGYRIVPESSPHNRSILKQYAREVREFRERATPANPHSRTVRQLTKDPTTGNPGDTLMPKPTTDGADLVAAVARCGGGFRLGRADPQPIPELTGPAPRPRDTDHWPA